MASPSEWSRSGLVMQLVGVAMMVLALMWLVVADDPFPMWLILAGGGVTFLGVGASIRTHDN